MSDTGSIRSAFIEGLEYGKKLSATNSAAHYDAAAIWEYSDAKKNLGSPMPRYASYEVGGFRSRPSAVINAER